MAELSRPDVEPPTGPAPDDLVIEDIVVGDGPEATDGSLVSAHYVGVTHEGGEQFDASWDRGDPLEFRLGVGMVIQGWDEGIAGMKVGGRRRLDDPRAQGLRRARRGRRHQARRDPGLRRRPRRRAGDWGILRATGRFEPSGARRVPRRLDAAAQREPGRQLAAVRSGGPRTMSFMQVEVWSDVVCPWCYIGKRRLESALEQFPHRDQVEVVWRSFQLDPSVPEGTTHPTLPALAAKYGRSEEEMRGMQAHVEQVAAGEGLEYHLADGVSGNTLLAHELLHLAAEHGKRNELKERLLHAYFEEGRPVFDVESLVPFAVEVGLDEAEVREALADRRYLAAVREDGATAQALGATGVPFFVVDRKYGAAGAQPAELLLQILERAWADAHPLVTVPAAEGCDDGTCAV